MTDPTPTHPHICEIYAETGKCSHRPPLTLEELETSTLRELEEAWDQMVDMSEQIARAFRFRDEQIARAFRFRDEQIARAFRARDRAFSRLVKAWNKR